MAEWMQQFPDNYNTDSGFGAKFTRCRIKWSGGMRNGLRDSSWRGCLRFPDRLRKSRDHAACARRARVNASWRFASRSAQVRWRLLRQMLTESVLLALAGGAVGSVLSDLGTRTCSNRSVRARFRASRSECRSRGPDRYCIVSVGTGILFGLVPALASAKPELTEALKEGGRVNIRRAPQSGAQLIGRCGGRSCPGVARWRRPLAEELCARCKTSIPVSTADNVLTVEIDLPAPKYPRVAARLQPRWAIVNFWNEALAASINAWGRTCCCTTILPLSGSNTRYRSLH